MLETASSAMGLLGLALGAFVSRKLLMLPALVAVNVLMHAQNGRYPLMPLFRRLGAYGKATPAEPVRAALSAVAA